MTFATVALAELAFVYCIRSPRDAAWRGPRNRALFGSVLLSGAFLACAIYLAPLQAVFATAPLGPAELGVVLALSLLPATLVEATKLLRRRNST
jgi:hypothetical protein